MAFVTPSWVQTHPSYVMPEILLKYNQASGAFSTLAGGDPMARLGSEDLYAYIKAFDIRTEVAVGQSGYNSLPSVAMTAQMISTPSYLIKVRAEYDHHDTAAAGNWGTSLPEAQRVGMRQGVFQELRGSLLYGFNPTNGEGLLNTNGATTVNLPPDSFGDTTVVTYDNGQMAAFLLTQISATKTRTMQMGMPARVVILGPQRTLSAFEYQGIVQLTSYQRPGAGSASVRGTVEGAMGWSGDTLEWVYDDTLIGKGAGGTDAVLVVIPEIKKPKANKINTNEFAQLEPGLDSCTLQLCDMAAPREITSPLAGGAIDVLSELRATSGWGIRPEAIEIISMQYS